MNEFEYKYQNALQEMKVKGLKYPWYLDQHHIFVFFKMLGFKVRPPYYNNSSLNILILFIWLSPFFFLVTVYVLKWNYENIPYFFQFLIIVVMPIILSVFIAKIYRRRALRVNLKKWEDL